MQQSLKRCGEQRLAGRGQPRQEWAAHMGHAGRLTGPGVSLTGPSFEPLSLSDREGANIDWMWLHDFILYL